MLRKTITRLLVLALVAAGAFVQAPAAQADVVMPEDGWTATESVEVALAAGCSGSLTPWTYRDNPWNPVTFAAKATFSASCGSQTAIVVQATLIPLANTVPLLVDPPGVAACTNCTGRTASQAMAGYGVLLTCFGFEGSAAAYPGATPTPVATATRCF